jgi:tRNA uridine 5-carboxymethylaminomethyl modification enzyme
VQLALVRSIAGCANAHILRPGYSIEYDYTIARAAHDAETGGPLLCSPDQWHDGYEEAAARGLLAGINAAR